MDLLQNLRPASLSQTPKSSLTNFVPGDRLPLPSNYSPLPVPNPPLFPVPIQALVVAPQYVPQFSPNAKLDLCCRKQGVSPMCQQMCNFDTFTDRTVKRFFGVKSSNSILF